MELVSKNINQLSFQAHTYKMRPQSNQVDISIDKEDLLGENPYLVYDNDSWSDKIPMEKEGDKYSSTPLCDASCSKLTYHIDYDDTGKKDLKNGGDYRIDLNKLGTTSAVILSKMCRQPLIHALKSGKTVGEVVCVDDMYDIDHLKTKNEPFIIVAPQLRTLSKKLENPNCVGIISTKDDFASLIHHSSTLRQFHDVCASVKDPKIVKRLQNLNGEKIELEVRNNYIRFNKTDKPAKKRTYPKVVVPKLKPCDKVLTSKEYSPDVIGPKAVNLRRLEELHEQGKIDAIIPKSVALPFGYIKKLGELDKTPRDITIEFSELRRYKECYYKEPMNDLINKITDSGLNPEKLICRSAFNDEDLPYHSVAGLYYSDDVYFEKGADLNKELFNNLSNVVSSKYELRAIETRKKYQIPDEDVKQGVLIQDKVDADYTYTIYTDSPEDKVIIELIEPELSSYNKRSCYPHIFSYDKKTGKLSYDSIMEYNMGVTFDENENVIDIDLPESDLSGNEKVFNLVKKAAQNALVLEKEFGAPQDVEGGIKGDDIYFWQTRNIINESKGVLNEN